MDNNYQDSLLDDQTITKTTIKSPARHYRILFASGVIIISVITIAMIFFYNANKTSQKEQASIPAANEVSPTTSINTGNAKQLSTSQYSSIELGINFEYPTELGNAHEGLAAEGSLYKDKGEQWWKINFDRTDFGGGYYEVSASTPEHYPNVWEWENASYKQPHWFNEKISIDETEDSLYPKLSKTGFLPEPVGHSILVTNKNNVSGYKIWLLECNFGYFVSRYNNSGGGCFLSRMYIVPLSNKKYNNLILYTLIRRVSTLSSSVMIEFGRSKAGAEIIKAEKYTPDPLIKKHMDMQDIIYNSLVVN